MNLSTFLKVGVTGGVIGYLLCKLRLREHITHRTIIGGDYCILCGQVVEDGIYVNTVRAVYDRDTRSIERKLR